MEDKCQELVVGECITKNQSNNNLDSLPIIPVLPRGLRGTPSLSL